MSHRGGMNSPIIGIELGCWWFLGGFHKLPMVLFVLSLDFGVAMTFLEFGSQ